MKEISIIKEKGQNLIQLTNRIFLIGNKTLTTIKLVTKADSK